MTPAIALDSRRVALDLHALLHELDPLRWRDDLEARATERLVTLRQRLVDLLESTWPEPGAGGPGDEGERDIRPVQHRLSELAGLLDDHLPQVSQPTTRPGPQARSRREAWMALRAELQPLYEELAASLRDWSIHVPVLRPANPARNLFHAGWGVAAILMVEHLFPTREVMLATIAAVFCSAWTVEITRRLVPSVNELMMWLFGPFAHPHETHRVNSATWYTTALLGLAWLAPVPVGIAAVAVLGFGDPAAALVGRRFGRIRLLHGRSLEGSLAFVAAGGAAAAASLLVWHPELGGAEVATISLAGAVGGAIGELCARRVDDNLLVPVAAALAASAALWVLP